MSRPRPECGTNGGYHAHRRRNEKACVRCRAAHIEINRAYQARYSRALRELMRRHPTEFRMLMEELLAAEKATL